MKKLIFIVPFMVLIIIFNACSNDNDDAPAPSITLEKQIIDLKAAIAPYTNLDAAMAAGYDLDPTGYVSQMGHHYLNTSIANISFIIEKPHVLLFDQDGVFVGVEYAVPITSANQPAPEGFIGDTDVWYKTLEENFWTLHVWVGIDNPNGIFARLNPNLP